MSQPVVLITRPISQRERRPLSRKSFTMAEPHPIVAELLEKHKIIVVTTASPNWNEIRATYQNGNPAKPLGIARPKSAEEVSTIVKTARRHGIKVTVRGGGHDVATRCFADGCLAIDVREIKSIEISADETTATVGGGILIEDVIKTLSDRKLVTPFGYMPGVGYAGWAMMGGYGWLAPSLGLGVDQILRARVVTAQGDIIEADGELLKGIRGAGGNFGVIVELGIKIYPLEKVSASWPFREIRVESDKPQVPGRTHHLPAIRYEGKREQIFRCLQFDGKVSVRSDGSFMGS